MPSLFNGYRIFICKANLSKLRRTMLEAKVKENGGYVCENIMLSKTPTHIVIDDALCGDIDKCRDILEDSGYGKGLDCEIVRLEWICECLSQNTPLSSKPFIVDLKSTATDHNNDGDSDDERYDSETEMPQLSNQPPTKKFKQEEAPKYLCSQSSLSSDSTESQNKNIAVITELQKLSDAFRARGDQWRTYSYEKAISAIKNFGKEITSYEVARKIPGLGAGIAEKVMEMILDGRIRKVEEVCGDEQTKTLELFSKVWGAGPATVQSWYQQGFRTLDDLESKASLTKQQKIGLKYFDEIQDRMSRSEVEEIARIVKEKALSICKNVELVICGSYRRGKQTCGDVDLLLIRPDEMCSKELLISLLAKLKTIGFISDDLTPLESNGNHHKYMGLCKLPGEERKHRRLDIFIVPERERAPALMHYTGSALFNRSIRLLASRKSMSLSEHCLSADIFRKGAEKCNEGRRVETPTEESIFEILGLEYRPPEERDH
ncbi:hypothetical protein LSTR_LSTR001243 [Laodelphax striatellus]|uniref:DNA polymerase n=1 Tax=Laodelphax striatellus TaxID=195883 RepID=A0A482XAS4_LAOST|nr:hypothetical protein LSTR_LSTR001243 [Laodelphax striatellus]